MSDCTFPVKSCADCPEDKDCFPVVTAADVVRFNKAQLGRAKLNLFNAEKRGDKRAAANIKRKMAVYEYTINLAEYYNVVELDIRKKIEEYGK